MLGYHGCEQEIAERLLRNESFVPSANEYDWLGSGVYFWEANPDRALEWAQVLCRRKTLADGISRTAAVVGAVIDPGVSLDLVSSSGISVVEQAYHGLQAVLMASGTASPENSGGDDLLARYLDCAVINFIHESRAERDEVPFDTIRGIFTEGRRIYPTSGFRLKTHIQICVRNQASIKGIFRVPPQHFSSSAVL